MTYCDITETKTEKALMQKDALHIAVNVKDKTHVLIISLSRHKRCDQVEMISHLTHACDSGDEQFAKKLVLHRHLCEEVINLIVISVRAVLSLSNHICKHKTGFCTEKQNNAS